MSPRHLLFDLDGTLLSESGYQVRARFIAGAVARMRARVGVAGALRGLRAVRLELEREIAEGWAPEETNQRRLARAFAAATGLAPDEAEALLAGAVQGVFPGLAGLFRPVTGARELASWALRSLPATLATNPVWPLAQVELRLRWAGFDPGEFRDITHAGVMHACKPSVSYYREVLERAGGLGDPGGFLLIGNCARKDLPATRAGIPVFILAEGRSAPRALEPIAAPAGALAPAWRGSFAALREALEAGGLPC